MYRKDIEPKCQYCQYSKPSVDELLYLCGKKGLVSFDHHCRHFRYDPIRRVPKRPAPLNTDFSEEDFKL